MSVSDGLLQKAHYLQTDTPPSLYEETPVPPGEALMVPRDEETETAVSKEEVQTQLWNHKVTKVTHPRAGE